MGLKRWVRSYAAATVERAWAASAAGGDQERAPSAAEVTAIAVRLASSKTRVTARTKGRRLSKRTPLLERRSVEPASQVGSAARGQRTRTIVARKLRATTSLGRQEMDARVEFRRLWLLPRASPVSTRTVNWPMSGSVNVGPARATALQTDGSPLAEIMSFAISHMTMWTSTRASSL
jgi:hypothetical protein